MPFVNVRTARGLLSRERRRALQRRLTDAVVEIEGRGNPDFARFVTVVVEELDPEAWCLGGQSLDEEAVAALAASLG